MSGDRGIAEEATQEAFARCLERWRRLGDQPWVAGWVTTTAMNQARRMLRRAARDRLQSFDPAPSSAEVGVNDPSMDLWAAIRRLPDRQREAVVLYYALDLPVKYVAGAMGCQEGTVKAHLARARETLRERLEAVPDER
jgi:RNA polymerase sigma-70 factor (ECF subfamily)